MKKTDCDKDCLSCNTDIYISCEKRINPNTRPDPDKVEEPTREDLISFARDCQKYYKEGQEIMRKHNLCIDNLDDNMQKLAFTFYTDLCEIDSKARHLFQEGYGDDNYHDERLPAGVTYSPEHDKEIRNQVLNELRDIIRNTKKYGSIEPEELFHWTGIIAIIDELRPKEGP